MQKHVIIILAALTILLTGMSATAQTSWLQIRDFNRIQVDVSKVSADLTVDQTLLSTFWFASGNFALSEQTSILFDLPFANFDVDVDGFDAETMFGNPFIGVEIGRRYNGGYALIGGRVPLAPEDKFYASLLGAYGHIDRFEAFLPDVVSFTGNGGFKKEFDNGAGYNAMGGLNLMMPTEGNGDSELYLNYKFEFRFRSEKAGFAGGVHGRYLITESDLDFGERTVHLVGLKADYVAGNVIPGIHFYFPFDKDLSDIINTVIGINVTFNLGEEDTGDYDF
jgi:hypothetical protein